MEPDEESILNVRKLSLIITIGALFLVIFFNFTKGKNIRGDNSTTTDWAYFNFDLEARIWNNPRNKILSSSSYPRVT